MSKKIILGSLGAAAVYMSAAFPAMAKTEIVGIEELREACLQHNSHEQIRAGKVTFKCRKDVDFWVSTGSKNICLPNEGTLCVQAYIKGQQYSTEWWGLPYQVDSQLGQCEEYEQWKATTMYSEPGSCELLEKITLAGGEVAFCEARMEEEGHNASTDETIQQIQQNPTQAEEIRQGSTVSILEKTGVEIKCDRACPAPAPRGDMTTTSSSSYSSSSLSSSDIVGLDRNDPHYSQVGAKVHQTTIKKNFWKKNHKVVVVEEDPMPGSQLHRMRLQKGDHISRINGDRIRSVGDMLKSLRKARGKVVVKYIRQDQSQVNTLQQF
ncbi:MAG: hypothetical protein AB8G05_19370 [Oligoflexales bacterium]